MSRRLLLLVLTVSAFACVSAPAHAAGEIIFQPTMDAFIYIGGDAGSQITVSESGGNWVFTDSDGVGADSEGGCTQNSPNQVTCPGVIDLVVAGNGGADTIDLSGMGGHTSIQGGPGADTITGGSGPDYIDLVDDEADQANCGPGPDEAWTDDGDVVTNCETVSGNSPLIQFSAPSGTEGSPLKLTIGLNKPAKTAFTVDYAVTHGSTDNSDFSPAGAPSGTVSFAPGDTSKTVDIPTSADTAVEPDEQFTVTLSNISPSDAARNSTVRATGTILNDDVAPVASVSDASVSEGGVIDFDVTLDKQWTESVTVNFAIPGNTAFDTATQGVDYAAPTETSVTFAPGQTKATVSVSTLEDEIFEPDEQFLVTLTSATGATLGDSSGTLGILNDDTQPTLSISGSTDGEGDDLVYTVTKTGATASSTTVDYATSDGTATAPADYTSKSGTLTFAPGETTKTFTVPTSDDEIDEDNQTVTATLSNPANATISGGPATGTITDHDEAPVVLIAGGSAVEGAPATFTITKAGNATERTVSVDYATADGSAKSPGDYTTETGTVTLAPGDTSKTFDVATVDDAVDEEDKTVGATLSNPANALLDVPDATATITDDEASPKLAITGGQAREGQPITFTVKKAGATERTVSAAYATADGTARAPGDYAQKSGTLTLAPGETTTTFTVATAQDTADEPDEKFAAALSDPQNASAGDAATGTIADDDTTPRPRPRDPTGPGGPAEPRKLQPTLVLSARPARDRSAPFRYVLRGRLKLPAGDACPAGAPVRIAVRRAGRRRAVARRSAKLSPTCKFRTRLSFRKRPGSGRLRAVASFAGTDELLPARSRARKLRAG